MAIEDNDEDLGFEAPAADKPRTDVLSTLDATINDTIGESGDEVETEKAAEQASGDQTGAAVAKDRDGKPVDGKPQQGQEAKGPSPAGAKDLVLADGTVIKAGPERRFYEQLSVARQQNAAHVNTNNQLRTHNDQLRTENTTMRQTLQSASGVAPEQLNGALTLYTQLKQDPVGTINALLTEARAAGYNIESAGSSVDVAAITRNIEAKFAPLLQERQQQQFIEQQNAEVQQEVGNFYAQYPDARLHDDVMARIIEANPSMSLTDAYFQLKGAVASRGLDWSLPLEAQVKTPSEQKQQQAPMTQGRVPLNGMQPANRVHVADANTSTADIVRAAMRESGLNV